MLLYIKIAVKMIQNIKLESLITPKYLLKQAGFDDPTVEVENIPDITDEAVELIKHYLRPYLEELDRVQNFDFMDIINSYPLGTRNQINTYASLYKREGNDLYSLTQTEYDNLPGLNKHDLFETKIFIVNQLISSISDEDFINDLVDPWRVEISFRTNKRARKLFHLPPLDEDEHIYVNIDVTLDDNKFVHKMSEDLVNGIITFYKALGLQHPLSMYGKHFVYETNRIAPIPEGYNPTYGYTVQLNNQIYQFNDIEFMRGLITAAQWNNVDPHQYITNLNKYEVQPYRKNPGGLQDSNQDTYLPNIPSPPTIIPLTF